MVIESGSPVLARVRELVTPIASDLGLEVYDVEQRGGTLRVTLDTPVGSSGGVTLDTLALASRLVSRELDHHDPVPGRYTLEVSSPGIERTLRTPAHFRREVGKVVAIRLADVGHDERRLSGAIVAADDATVTVRVDGPDGPTERTVRYDQIDRAKTVFEWPAAKPPSKGPAAKPPSKGPAAKPPSKGPRATTTSSGSSSGAPAPDPGPAEGPQRKKEHSS